ncbi:MAG: helix-turn-helix transcriptional regulator [Lachnospiraceae bacterium]|nr:helix-turn-helix transcriptional regulator [Lachnospiraceae bacterium]
MWTNAESDLGDIGETHRNPNEEFSFYLAIANGDLESIEQNCEEKHFQANDEGMGVLSKNSVTNLKYHLIITLALTTRFCIEAGMQVEYAFRLSDFYITQLDGIATEQGVIELHDYAVLDFTRKMKIIKNNFSTSKPINEALNYIYTYINERITIEDIAEHLELSESYLSRLFKKEVGMSVSDYIREQKIERAKNLLRHSDFSLIDIANHLSFSSQSHFIQVFKSQTGITPKAFRDKFYRTHWKTDSDTEDFFADIPNILENAKMEQKASSHKK